MSTTTQAPSKCCGCCCDYRQAVMIVDLIIMLLEAIVLVLLATNNEYANQFFLLLNDEDKNREMALSSVSIVLGIISMYGAYAYNIYPVLLNAVWLLIGYIILIVLAAQYCSKFLEYTGSSNYACSVNPT